EGAVGVEREGAVGDVVDQGGGQRVALGVGVVAQHTGRGVAERRVLVGRVARVVDRHRGVVDGVDRDRHRGGRGRVVGAVIRLVGEGVGAVEVRVRRGVDGDVGVEREGAVGDVVVQGGG